MSTRDRSLWPIDRLDRSFGDALTRDFVPTAHTCRPFLPALELAYAGESHDVPACPGPITLADVARAAFAGEE